MKVEVNNEFKPIVITLETRGEYLALRGLLRNNETNNDRYNLDYLGFYSSLLSELVRKVG